MMTTADIERLESLLDDVRDYLTAQIAARGDDEVVHALLDRINPEMYSLARRWLELVAPPSRGIPFELINRRLAY